MSLRRSRLLTYVPCLGISLLLVSSKAVGLISAILLVGLLIMLHELGHFLMARRMQVPVDVFSIGFGPRLCGFKWRETDVRLAAVPLGGYVRLAGEDSEAGTGLSEDHPFFQKPYHQRILFYAGGIIANVLTAFLLLLPLRVDDSRVTIRSLAPIPLGEVVKGQPADQAGLKKGDLLTAVGPIQFPGGTWDQAVEHIQSRGGQNLEIAVIREGQTLKFNVTPLGEAGAGRIGVRPDAENMKIDEIVRNPLSLAGALKGIGNSGKEIFTLSWRILGDYGKLVTGQLHWKEVGGPVSIVRLGSQAAQAGWRSFLFFAAFISLNLAVLNALPIPGLDGSHALILTLERIRGRNFSLVVKERILTTGFFLLIGLLVVVLGMDLMRLKS